MNLSCGHVVKVNAIFTFFSLRSMSFYIKVLFTLADEVFHHLALRGVCINYDLAFVFRYKTSRVTMPY